MKYVTDLTHYLRRLLTQPVGELSRGRRFLRYSIELALHCRRALKHDRAGEMAAALTYRTIFSLIPMVVMSLLVFKAMGGFEQVGSQIQDFIYKQIGLTSLSLPGGNDTDPAPTITPPPNIPPDDAATPPGATPGAAEPTGKNGDGKREVRANVDQVIRGLTDRVAQTSFGSIGTVGLLVLIYAALRLMITVEWNFNRIFNCPTNRSVVQQILVYWGVITLGPVLLAVSLYLANRATEVLSILGPVFTFLSFFTALAASWLLLFLVYVLMPNTKVRLQPAIIGALVAAVMWELGKWAFKLYVTKVAPFSVYAGLGLIPLFLYWVYLTWLIVLFGLELTYTLQAMKGRRFKYDRDQPKEDLRTDPQWLVPILTRVGQAFNAGAAVGQQKIAEELRLPVRAVAELSQKLVDAGLLHQVQVRGEGDTGFSLALPPDQVRIAHVLQIGRTMTRPKEAPAAQPGWAYLDHLALKQEQANHDVTLASLLNGLGQGGAEPVTSP